MSDDEYRFLIIVLSFFIVGLIVLALLLMYFPEVYM